MAFWSSDEEDKKKEEMQEVKRKVEGSETGLPEPPEPAPKESPEAESSAELVKEEMPPEPTAVEEEGGEELRPPSKERTEQVEEGLEEPSLRTEEVSKGEEEEEFAPLFVRIGKYRQILQNIEEVKNSLQDLRDLFALMNEVDQTKREGMKELRQGISQLADALISMDEKFIRPAGSEETLEEPKSEVSITVENLRDQLEDVRSELNRIE